MHFDEQSGAWEGGDVDMSGFESDQKDVPSSRTTSTYPDVETLQRPLHCKSSTSSVIRTDPEANYKKAPTIEPEEKPPLRTGSLKNMVNSRVVSKPAIYLPRNVVPVNYGQGYIFLESL